MDKHPYKIILLSVLLIAAIGIIIVLSGKKQQENSTNTLPVAEAQESQLTSVVSPDGKLTLTMKESKTQDNTTYSFLTTNSDGTQKEVFTKIVPSTSTLSIPANTFSPDDKYIFLKEDDSGLVDYFVVTPSGTLDISSLFAAKYPNYKITDVTGWGGMTLIVVNVNNSDGSIGPSFWFNVSGKSFIQLSDRFN